MSLRFYSLEITFFFFFFCNGSLLGEFASEIGSNFNQRWSDNFKFSGNLLFDFQIVLEFLKLV